MSVKNDGRQQQTESMILARLSQLRPLSYKQVAALPRHSCEQVSVGGSKRLLDVYVEPLGPAELLVTVYVWRTRLFGMCYASTSRGLVFSLDGTVRDATIDEILNSGG